MAELKLTKSELRIQQQRLSQLEKYLPMLRLKKAMLQAEVQEARLEIVGLEKNYSDLMRQAEEYSSLLSDLTGFDPTKAAHIDQVKKRYDNIAGVEVPYFESISFTPYLYSLFDTPPHVDGVVIGLRTLAEALAKIEIAREKKSALEKELREVSIRVNLFEKILIPRCLSNIKKIKVFLGDQQLAAVGRAKVAKTKIEERQSTAEETLHAL